MSRVFEESGAALRPPVPEEAARKARPPFPNGTDNEGRCALDRHCPCGIAKHHRPLVGRHAQFILSVRFPSRCRRRVRAWRQHLALFDTPARSMRRHSSRAYAYVIGAESMRRKRGGAAPQLARTRSQASSAREILCCDTGDSSRRPSDRCRPARTGAESELDPDPLEPRPIHRIVDPEIGDGMLVVTAQPPARGILRGQNFAEFRVLPSIHGLAFAPVADDLSLTLIADGAILRRPTGLAISDLPSLPPAAKKVEQRKSTPLDVEIWKAEQATPFNEREAALVHSVATSPAGQRASAPHAARFYLAHVCAEAKGGWKPESERTIMLSRPLYYLMRGISDTPSAARPRACPVQQRPA